MWYNSMRGKYNLWMAISLLYAIFTHRQEIFVQFWSKSLEIVRKKNGQTHPVLYIHKETGHRKTVPYCETCFLEKTEISREIY